MRIGPILRSHRKWTDRTVEDLAKEIGLTTPTLSRLERGENIDGQTMGRVLIWLLSDGSDKNNKTVESKK